MLDKTRPHVVRSTSTQPHDLLSLFLVHSSALPSCRQPRIFLATGRAILLSTFFASTLRCPCFYVLSFKVHLVAIFVAFNFSEFGGRNWIHATSRSPLGGDV